MQKSKNFKSSLIGEMEGLWEKSANIV